MREALLGHLLGVAITLTSVDALAQDARRESVDLAPLFTLDTGLGFSRVTLGSSHFGAVTGSTIGLRQPNGLLIYETLHLFPFRFRGLGFAATYENVSLTSDATARVTVPTDSDGSQATPTLNSFLIGPEAQARFGPFLLRGSALGGVRVTNYASFSATEWRLGFHGQADWVVMNFISLGVFAGADVAPGLGWSTGMSFSFGLF
jgi:hypothetical protein